MQNFGCSLDEILQKGYYLVSSSYSNFCVRDSATTTSVNNVLLKLQCHVRIYFLVLCNSLSLTAGDSEKLHRLR